jgi:UDP-glucuronate 4-epimerase
MILVTGAAGFIGSTLVDYLLSKEQEVLAIDNFDDFYSTDLKSQNIRAFQYNKLASFIKIDLLKDDLTPLFNHKIDTVIHLAAKAGVRQSFQDPKAYYDNNVTGTINLLNKCLLHNVKKFIFASSSSVYGTNPDFPYNEDSFLQPMSPYAKTKMLGEQLLHSYSYCLNSYYSYYFGINRLQTTCLRFFTVYGPRQRPEMAISNFIQKILNDEEITVYGDGSIRRSFTYVDDIVSGILNCLDIQQEKPFEIFNLGTDEQPITINEIIKMIEDITKKKAKIKYVDKAEGDMPITWSDISKAKKLLGYKPQNSIYEGLKKTIANFKNL